MKYTTAHWISKNYFQLFKDVFLGALHPRCRYYNGLGKLNNQGYKECLI
jgi:hypothetical protein